ncbi:vWA domain-containing protein [Nocardioides sp. WG-D5]
MFVAVVDDSGSVTAPGGSDPISNRYAEIRAALVAVGQRCRCKRELATVAHFDTPAGDISAQRLTRLGIRALDPTLRLPLGGAGTSNLRPAVHRVGEVLRQYPEHDAVVAVLSDFQITDSNPDGVLDELAHLPATVYACVLGAPSDVSVPGADVSIAIPHGQPPGALAKAILHGLTRHRLAPSPA